MTRPALNGNQKIFAYRTKLIGIESIVFAESAGKAKYATYYAATDAGYHVRYVDVKCNRAREYDCRLTRDNCIPVIGRPHDATTLQCAPIRDRAAD